MKYLFLVCIVILQSCVSSLPAEDIGQIRSGKSFNRLGEYVIGPGDTLQILVQNEESLTGTFVVSPQGSLKLPIVGEVPASGKSTKDLAINLRQRLRRYVKNPVVSVQSGPIGITVYFTGETAKKGPVRLQGRRNLLEAISTAGGLTTFASERIILIRNQGNGVKKRYATTYEDILLGRNNLYFLYLEDGDYIHAE